MTTAITAFNWIDGEWIDSGHLRESIDPATYQVIGAYADGGVAEADIAIAAARCVFETTQWRRDPLLRARVLEELAASFERHTAELIEQLALENGKIKGDATFEVSMVPSKLRFCAAMARADYGRSGTPRSDVLSIVLREPIGVAGIIVPWNSPVVLMIRSLAPDSAAGATAVIKMPDCFQRVPTSWCPP